MDKNGILTDNSNIDFSQSTKKRLASQKLFLLICAAVVTFCDLLFLISALVTGYKALICIFAFVLTLADALFVVAICFGNFRFRYTLASWIIYIVISVVFSGILIFTKGTYMSHTTFTDTAYGLNIFAHIVLWIGIIVCALLAIKKSDKIRFVIGISVASIVCISLFAYMVFALSNGYYGQNENYEYRAILYTYDEEEDGYIADGVADGRGTQAIIPATFNGKKVFGISAQLLTNKTLTNVDIQSKEVLRLVNFDKLVDEDVNKNVQIGVDKNFIDVYRLMVMILYKDQYYLANNMYPTGLAQDEVYVTFAYTEEQYAYVDYDVFPTWFGKKGDVFDIDAYNEVGYVAHMDYTDEEDVYWSAINCQNHQFAGVVVGESNIIGTKIEQSQRAQMYFDTVYRFNVLDDNDTKFEVSQNLKETIIDGQGKQYKYVAGRNISAFEADFAREGFSRTWVFEGRQTSSSLKFELLGNKGNFVIQIQPLWQLNTPSIDKVFSNNSTNSFVYGDEVVLNIQANAPVDGYDLTYKWYNTDNQVLSQNQEYVIGKALPSNSGAYYVEVVASSELTSLTSKSNASIDINVDKKLLRFEWSVDGDTYDGTEHIVSCDHMTEDALSGDLLSYEWTKSVTNAGKYNLAVQLDDKWTEYYQLDNTSKFAFEILPMQVEVQWQSQTTYEYNGLPKIPTAKAYGVDNAELDIDVVANSVNAGKYTAMAVCNNTNYKLTANIFAYEILPRVVSLVWDSQEFVYNGKVQYPKVISVDNVVQGQSLLDKLDYSGDITSKNAGEYRVEITILDKNYTLADSTQYFVDFVIAKKNIEVVWQENCEFEYDTEEHIAKVVDITGVLSEEKSAIMSLLAYSGYGINAGEYEASVSLNSSVMNYVLTGITTKLFEILPKSATITAVAQDKVYDGKGGAFSVTYDGIFASDIELLGEAEYYGDAVGAINAGKYTLNVRFDSDVLQNYTLEYVSDEFVISPKQVQLVWSVDREFAYDGLAHSPKVVIDGQEYADDIIVEYEYFDQEGQKLEAQPSQAGAYTVQAVVSSNNFVFSNTQVSFAILAEEVEL